MKQERLNAIQKQALRSISARAHNPKETGVSMIAVTPHEALAFVDAMTKVTPSEEDNQQAVS